MENLHKIKWENLATEPDMESKYIYTDGDLGFKESGQRDYRNLIIDDIYIKQFIGDPKFKVALEIGCGVGRMTEFLAQDFHEVYAIDVSKEMIKQGQKRLAYLKNIEWVETDGYHLPEAIQVDLIFSYIVFQHCSKEIVESNFIDIRKILLDSGIAKIQVRGKEIRQDKWYSGSWFTPDEIKHLAKKSGLEIVDVWQDPKEARYLWIWVT